MKSENIGIMLITFISGAIIGVLLAAGYYILGIFCSIVSFLSCLAFYWMVNEKFGGKNEK